jgi:zinc/manganese transport system substrate-binding protein
MHTPLQVLAALAVSAAMPAQEPLRVCATTPDLGVLAAAVGGDAVRVTTFVRGPEDPHFVTARPSMIKELSKADVLVEIGLELEIGWLPVLVEGCRNGRVQAGQPGRIDASSAIDELGVPSGPVDRSHGDVHARGNPHYLLDPVCGLQVGALLRDRFGALRPASAAAFAAGYTALRERLCAAMVGPELARLYEFEAEKLAALFAAGRLVETLRAQGDSEKLGGWFASLLPLRGSKVVADHDVYRYFTARFGVEVVDFLEPKPGVAPSTQHLQRVVERMRSSDVRALLCSPYFEPSHAEFVAKATGVALARMVHQVGALPGVLDYAAAIDHNVRALAAALAPR